MGNYEKFQRRGDNGMKNKKGWKRWKRIAAALLALLLTSGGVDLSGFAVNAKTEEKDAAVKVQTVITAFDALDREIMEQQLPVGASEEDIRFPETLTVTAKQITADADTDEQEADMDAADTDADETGAQDVGGAADTEKEEAADDQSTIAAEGKKADTDAADSDEQGADTDAADSDEQDADADADDTDDAGDAKEDTDTEESEAADEEAAIIDELFSVFTPLQVQAAGSDKKQLTLTGITWEIDPEESDGDTFDSSAESNDKCYVYVPILPDTDADGNELCLDEDAELPMIYVLIGERGISVIDENKANVQLASGASVSLQNDTLTYGEKLSKLKFKPVTFVDDNGKEVSGKLNWTAQDTKPDANTNVSGTAISGKTTDFDWTFAPDDSDYKTVTGKAKVTVYPAMPTVAQAPVIPAFSHTEKDYTVAEIFDTATTLVRITDINGNELTPINWSWWDEETEWKPQQKNLGAVSQTLWVVGEVNNTNYQDIKLQVALNVTKGTPQVTDVTVLGDYTHGGFLRDQTLSATVKDESGIMLSPNISYSLVWKAPDTQLSYTDDQNEYAYICIPLTEGYISVEGKVKVTVKQQAYPPNKPAESMNVSKSCDTVSKVSLPTDWKWRESDKDTQLTENGSSVSVTAEYTGSDKDNYQYTSVTVSITRSSCEHVESDVIVDTKPTCTQAGTGHTVCSRSECEQTVRSNITISATGHDYQRRSADIKNWESSDFYYYKCSVCSSEYKTAAPASSGSGSSGESSGGSSRSRKSSGSSAAAGATANVTPVSQNTGAEPFITSASGAQGWDAIRSYLTSVQAAAEGSVVTVNMNGAALVPSDVVEQIRGRAVVLIFDMGNGAAWVVNGLLMTAADEGAPFAVYYVDYLQGTLTLADVAVLPMDGMLAHIYTCGQQCFAITSLLESNG